MSANFDSAGDGDGGGEDEGVDVDEGGEASTVSKTLSLARENETSRRAPSIESWVSMMLALAATSCCRA